MNNFKLTFSFTFLSTIQFFCSWCGQTRKIIPFLLLLSYNKVKSETKNLRNNNKNKFLYLKSNTKILYVISLNSTLPFEGTFIVRKIKIGADVESNLNSPIFSVSETRDPGGQFHQHFGHILQMCYFRAQGFSPTKFCPTLLVHTTRRVAHLLCCTV